MCVCVRQCIATRVPSFRVAATSSDVGSPQGTAAAWTVNLSKSVTLEIKQKEKQHIQGAKEGVFFFALLSHGLLLLHRPLAVWSSCSFVTFLRAHTQTNARSRRWLRVCIEGGAQVEEGEGEGEKKEFSKQARSSVQE